jgi:hypothetical protein
MRTLSTGILVVLSLATPRAHAGDVAYQLEASALVACDETSISQPLALTIKDREWVTSGIEEADRYVDCERRLTWRLTPTLMNLEKEIWPRTRQLLFESEEGPMIVGIVLAECRWFARRLCS